MRRLIVIGFVLAFACSAFFAAPTRNALATECLEESTGHVRDPWGNPIAGALLTWQDSCETSAVTDSYGRYTTHIEASTVYATISHPDFETSGGRIHKGWPHVPVVSGGGIQVADPGGGLKPDEFTLLFTLSASATPTVVHAGDQVTIEAFTTAPTSSRRPCVDRENLPPMTEPPNLEQICQGVLREVSEMFSTDFWDGLPASGLPGSGARVIAEHPEGMTIDLNPEPTDAFGRTRWSAPVPSVEKAGDHPVKVCAVDAGFRGNCDAARLAGPPSVLSSTITASYQVPYTIQTEAEALEQDFATIAETFGWSVEGARAHWLGGQILDRLAQAIRTTRPDIFTGSVLSDEAYGPPSIYIKGTAPEDVIDLVSREEIPVVIVPNQRFSFDELAQRKDEVHEALLALGFEYVFTSADVTAGGTIETSVTRKPGLPDDEESIRAQLPSHLRDSVNVSVSDAPVVEEEHGYAGMRIKYENSSLDPGLCTSGWSVYKGSTGKTGVSTAGHCKPLNQIVEPGRGNWPLVQEGDHIGRWGDLAWKSLSTHIEPALFFHNAWEARRTNSLEPVGQIHQGESLCLFGRSSNRQRCAKVMKLPEQTSCGPAPPGNLVVMDRDASERGDSGGPWYNGSRAFGIHMGGCLRNNVEFSAFSVADYLDEALGVYVRLADLLPTRVTLETDDRLTSTDSGARFTAVMQSDGNFVIYQAGVGPIWDTRTYNNPRARIIMQADGNLVIYRPDNTAIWSTGTHGTGSGNRLVMQADGNLVMYRSDNTYVWASHTCCR